MQEYGMPFSFYISSPTDFELPKGLQRLAARLVHDKLLTELPNYGGLGPLLAAIC